MSSFLKQGLISPRLAKYHPELMHPPLTSSGSMTPHATMPSLCSQRGNAGLSLLLLESWGRKVAMMPAKTAVTSSLRSSRGAGTHHVPRDLSWDLQHLGMAQLSMAAILVT